MASVAFTPLKKLIHLLGSAPISEGAYVWVLDRGQLGLGTDPLHPAYVIDLAKEALVHRCDDEMPMNLEPINKTQTSIQKPSDSNGSRKEERSPSDRASQTSLVRRLEATKT